MDQRMCPCSITLESRTHVVGGCKMYKEDRNVLWYKEDRNVLWGKRLGK